MYNVMFELETILIKVTAQSRSFSSESFHLCHVLVITKVQDIVTKPNMVITVSLLQKLDWEGPVDNRTYTKKPNHFVKKITYDT